MLDVTEERWVEVEEHPDYEISSKGRLRSFKGREHGRIINMNYTGKDRQYPQCQFYYNKYKARYVMAAKVVAKAFIPGYNNERLCYFDGNPSNVSVENLYFIKGHLIFCYEGTRPLSRIREYTPERDLNEIMF